MLSNVAQSAPFVPFAVGETVATAGAYTTSGGLVVLGLPLSDWASIVTIGVGVIGLALTYGTSLYFKVRRDRREEALAARGLLPPTEEAGADDGD